MAISQTRYILITSGVGGESVAGQRQFGARLMTTNPLVPTNGVLEFNGGATALNNVGVHFGTNSPEYQFASKYFGFISKDAKQAEMISFARYTPTATAPQIISTITPVLSTLSSITDGSLKLTMGGVTQDVTGLNLQNVTSMASVAQVIETAIKSNTSAGSLWTSARVEFSNGSFVLTGGETGEANITAVEPAASGTDISGLIGWSLATNPIVSVGTNAETITEALSRISNTSNNFGSFDFVEELTTDEIGEVAAWTNAQNVMYVFSHAVTMDNYTAIQAVCAGQNGVCLTLNNSYMPMAIGACIDYDRVGAATNFMFNQFLNDTPSVTTDTFADTLDALKINYLGATQQAGKTIAFYQRGVLQGSISDIGVYWNEMWLKDAIITEFFNLLLSLKQLPANASGVGLSKGVIIPILTQAQRNGVVQAGKELTSVQKAYITSISGDEEAWREVESIGYWMDVKIKEVKNGDVTEYHIDYLLIYAKGDSIRKVEGTNILI